MCFAKPFFRTEFDQAFQHWLLGSTECIHPIPITCIELPVAIALGPVLNWLGQLYFVSCMVSCNGQRLGSAPLTSASLHSPGHLIRAPIQSGAVTHQV